MTSPSVLESIIASHYPSDNNSPVNPCLETQEGAFVIECVTTDGRVYGFPYGYLSNYILEPNPVLENASDAPPECLSLWFQTHQVQIFGWHLDSIRSLLIQGAGFTVKALASRYANLQPKQCFISNVAVLPTGR